MTVLECVQLAKLIVNSGGAAALVDYVADAQASDHFRCTYCM